MNKSLSIAVVMLLLASPILLQATCNESQETVTQITTDVSSVRLEKLEARLQQLEQRLREGSFWQPVEHVSLGFYNFRGNVQEHVIPETVVPAGATEVLVAVNWNSGNEGPSRFVDTAVWTQHSDGRKFSMYTSGFRYPQNALSYDTQCFWFPLTGTDRKLYVHSKDVQIHNCHGLKLHIIGYRQ